MDVDKFEKEEEQRLDPKYYNGQSDAEKLMHRHLVTPNDQITEAELSALKVGVGATNTKEQPAPLLEKEQDEDDSESFGTERVGTPLDVLGS